MLNFLASAALAGAGAYMSHRQGKKSAKAAKAAAAQQEAQYRKGLGAVNEGYDAALGFLEPYVQSGQTGIDYLMDILGANGASGQGAALDRYKGSPSSALLEDVLSEVTRRTGSEYAGAGGYRSGGRMEDLSRRLSDVRLNDYYKHENLIGETARMGQNAGTNAATMSANRGTALADLHRGIGDVRASGTVGAANARTGGMQAGLNYLAPMIGKIGGMDFLQPGNANVQWDTRTYPA